MEPHQININRDPVEIISNLYGIGPKLAERIVKYREKHGCFRGPKDLAQVEGISKELADILDTRINWQIPDSDLYKVQSHPSPSANKNQITGKFGYVIILVFDVLMLISVANLEIIPIFAQYVSGSTSAVAQLRIYISLFISFVFYMLGFLVIVIGGRLRDQYVSKEIIFTADTFWMVGLVSILYGALSMVMDINIHELLKNSLLIGAFFLIFFYLFSIIPIFIVLTRPSYAINPWVSGIFDFTILFTGPIIIGTAWVGRDNFTLTLYVIYTICGAILFALGINLLRTGQSPFRCIIGFIIPSESIYSRQRSNEYWLRWINTRLPDPLEQQALKSALDSVFKPSRWLTITGGVILAIGAWLFVTSLEAIIQWFVQVWISKIINVP